MTNFSYKSGGRVSRYLSDYRDMTVGTLNVSYKLEDWWEDTKQTQRIEEITYGTVGQYGSYGIGSQVKGSGGANDTQIATGGIFVVGDRGNFRFSGAATCFAKSVPITSITCSGGVCIYSYEAGNVSETVGQHGSSVINAGIGARRIDSFQFVFDTWKSIVRFVGAAECRVYNYTDSDFVEEFNELDYGLITANAGTTLNYGNISDVHGSGEVNHGYIRHTTERRRFGFKKIIGQAQARATNAWRGSGRIRKFGREESPLLWKWIADGKVRISGTAEESIPRRFGSEGGSLRLDGTCVPVITAITTGDGNLRKFGGSAESATFNPDEKQMLFSFTGGITSEKHVESYVGSGRIKNLSKIEKQTGTFGYIGSGLIQLKPRKEVTLYQLQDLANYTLEIDTQLAPYWKDPGDNTYSWNGTKKLGAVLLKNLYETDHEKHTEVYDQGAVVEFVRKDYGSLVNTNLTNCVANSGTISTNTVATSGCIKVAPGTTLAIAPSNTYTIPNQLTTPTSAIDYGSVSDGAAARNDYGWILDTADLRTPYGLGLRFISHVEVVPLRTFDFTSTGEPPIFKIIGDTTLPLDVAEDGSGNLFTMGGAAEAVSNTKVGEGLWRFTGDSRDIRTRNFVGSGRIPVFTGAAESLTFNPTERRMLFSIIGGITSEKHTEVFVGSGNLFTFSGASESTSYSPELRGLFRIGGDSHDTRARDFVGSGSLRKFSGFAESVTFNPLERQLLFSFAGSGTEKHTEVYVGSGKIRKLSGSAECIRWSAQHTTGLYRISGNAIDKHTENYTGSGRIPVFTGAAESLTFNPEERQMLFSFTGGAVVRNTYEFIGSGFLRNFATLDERQTFDWVGSGAFKLNPRKPQTYELSELGSFTLDFYSLKNAYINIGNIDFYNQANTNLGYVQLKWLNLEEGHEKHTEAYNNSACFDDPTLDYGFLVNQNLSNCVANSGTISTNTTAANGCIKVAPGTTLTIATGVTYTIPNQLTTPSSNEDYGLVSDGNAPEWRDYGHILDTTSKVCPYGLWRFTGTAKTHYVENIIGDCSLRLFGAGDTFWTPPYFGNLFSRFYGSLHESFTPAPYIGSGSIRKLSGAAECIANVEKADGLFKIGSEAYTLFSLLHPGSGTIRVLGTVAESFTPTTYIGSGSLRKLSGAAESATWNPLEKQMLFSFTGSGTEIFAANPPEEGTEIRLSGTTHPELLTFAEQPFGRIPISGEGATPRTRPFIGSGSFKKFSGAAESITFNPLEKQLLFSFTGSGTERVTLNPPEEGAEIRLRGTVYTTATISQESTIRIPIFGEAFTTATLRHIGSGSLKKFSGAAESITFNPLERQLLFSFTGTGSENTVAVPPEGDGRLFTFNGSTATSAAAFESTGLFRVGGVSVNVTSLSQIGSGSLRKISGAAESITFNPDEKQMLFSFTGESSSSLGTVEVGSGRIPIYPEAADYRFIPNWNSVGGVRIEIQSAYRFAPVWIGSGSLRKFSGAAESLTFNPEEKQMLFSFTGSGSENTTSREISKGGTLRLGNDAHIVWVPNNIGSGNIFITGTAKTHYVPDIEGSGRLYNFSGAAESQTIAITSIPSLFRVYGDGHVSRTRPYAGSGSLRKLGGSAESLTVNPDEKQMLFSFLGESTSTRTRSESGQGTVKTLGDAVARFSPVFFGSGTARVSGEVYVTRSRDFVGFGSLRKLSGAAESLTFNPEEKQMLFSFIGEGTQARTSKLLSQGGVLTVRGTSGDPLLTFAEQPRIEIDITGDSYDLRAYGYAGSGRISNVNNADDSYVRAPYKGSGRIALSGIALVQVQLFQPPHTQVWII